MKGIIIICCLLFTLNAAAQEQATTDSVSPQDSSTSLMGKLRHVQQILDDKARAKVDPRYIEVPGSSRTQAVISLSVPPVRSMDLTSG